MTWREPLGGVDAAASGLDLEFQLGVFEVRIELGDAITDEEVRHDLEADPFHWLLEFKPRLTHASSGRVVLDLMIPGPDVWTTALTTMAVLQQSSYGMHALHVVTQEARDQQSAA